MKKPQIALVVPSLAGDGGVPAVARFLKNRIVDSQEFRLKLISLATSGRDDSSVRLVKPSSWAAGVTVQEGVWEGLPFFHVGAVATELEFQRYRRRGALSNILSECDLIQVVSGSPAWALPVIELNRPVVLQVATRTLVERRRKEQVDRGPIAMWRWCMTRVTDYLDDRALRNVDAVLVENKWMEEYASNIGENTDVWVRYAPPGLDAKLFHPAKARKLSAPKGRYILSVGRFDDKRKNVDLLLDSYCLMRQGMTNPPILMLVGTGDPGQAFWERAKSLDLESQVCFDLNPSQEKLIDYYQNAMCFALSSEEEGFGVVVIEAMACGVPVIATRCGGPDGIITHGSDGFLVPVGDSTDMADKLRQLVENPVANLAMGRAARRTVEGQFTEEISGEAFLDTYRILLERKIRPGIDN